MPISAEGARQLVQARLHAEEEKLNAYGSALPSHASRKKLHLMITKEEERDFGWLFFYNTREHVIDGDVISAIAGNWPFVVYRETGAIEHMPVSMRETFLAERRQQNASTNR
ncbi:MAG: YrhB domain-containing protein [Nibricoccus sp.]